jgi:hypothetical protein
MHKDAQWPLINADEEMKGLICFFTSSGVRKNAQLVLAKSTPLTARF